MRKGKRQFAVRESRIKRGTFNVVDIHRRVAVRMWLPRPEAVREASALNRVGAQ